MLTRKAVVLARIEEYRPTLVGSTINTVIFPIGASTVDDFYRTMWIVILAGPQAGSAREIIRYVGATRTATVAPDFAGVPGNVLVSVRTYGIDAAPTGAVNAILTSRPEVKPTGEKLERNVVRETLSTEPHMIGMKEVEVTFETELKGIGRVSTPPEIAPLFRACGFAETINVGVNVVYNPISVAFESLTLWVYLDYVLHRIVGCRGTFDCSLEAGKFGILKWTFKGLYAEPVNVAPPATTVSTMLPPIFVSASLRQIVGAVTYLPIASKISFDVKNEIGKRLDVNLATGLREFLITARAPSGTFDPEVDALANKNLWREWTAGISQRIICQVGTTPWNRILVDVPRANLESLAYGDREGIMTYDVPFTCNRFVANDDLIFTFF